MSIHRARGLAAVFPLMLSAACSDSERRSSAGGGPLARTALTSQMAGTWTAGRSTVQLTEQGSGYLVEAFGTMSPALRTDTGLRIYHAGNADDALEAVVHSGKEDGSRRMLLNGQWYEQTSTTTPAKRPADRARPRGARDLVGMWALGQNGAIGVRDVGDVKLVEYFLSGQPEVKAFPAHVKDGLLHLTTSSINSRGQLTLSRTVLATADSDLVVDGKRLTPMGQDSSPLKLYEYESCGFGDMFHISFKELGSGTSWDYGTGDNEYGSHDFCPGEETNPSLVGKVFLGRVEVKRTRVWTDDFEDTTWGNEESITILGMVDDAYAAGSLKRGTTHRP